MLLLNKHICGSNEGWTIVDRRVTEAATTGVEFTGLQGNKDVAYKIICLTHSDPTSETRLRINDDATSNYSYVYTSIGLIGINTSTGTETSFPLSSGNATPEQVIAECIISAKSGFASGHSLKAKAGTNGSDGGDSHLRAGGLASSDEIIKIGIYANVGILTTGRFAAGCVFELYKLVDIQ